MAPASALMQPTLCESVVFAHIPPKRKLKRSTPQPRSAEMLRGGAALAPNREKRKAVAKGVLMR